MTKIFLKDEHLRILIEIFKKTVPNSQIWAFGSRVKEDAHQGSDLDLVLVGDDNVILLKEALQESDIPFLVDIVNFNTLKENFKNEILKKYVILYKP